MQKLRINNMVKAMKRYTITFISALLVVLFITSAYADTAIGYNEIDYSARFEINEDGFKQLTPNYKDWKNYIEKFNLIGTIKYADLFNEHERINAYNILRINDKFMLDFDYKGSQQYYWLHSNVLNEKLHFNAHNYYEFMLKGYFFLNLPTQKIALLTYPFGIYSAFKPFNDFIKNYIDPIDHDMVIPYSDLESNVVGIKKFFDTESICYQFFRTASIESGISDLVYYDFVTADEYLKSFAEGEDMYVTIDGDTKIFTLAGYEIIRYKKSEKTTDISINLPTSLNEIGYVSNIRINKNSNNNYDIDASLSLNMDESEYLKMSATISDFGLGIRKNADGEIKISVGGDGLGYTENLYLKHKIENLSDKNSKLRLSYIDSDSQKELISLNVDIKKNDVEAGSQIFEEAYNQEDYFSINDQTLKGRRHAIKMYAKKAIIPLIMETPARVIDDVFDYMDNSGLLSVLFAK